MTRLKLLMISFFLVAALGAGGYTYRYVYVEPATVNPDGTANIPDSWELGTRSVSSEFTEEEKKRFEEWRAKGSPHVWPPE